MSGARPTSASHKVGRLAGSAALGAVGGAVSGLCGFATTAWVARELGAATAGIFGVAVAVSMIVTQIGKLGADTAFVHFLPRLHMYPGARDNARRLLGLWLGLIGGCGLLAAVVLWVFADDVAGLVLRGTPEEVATAVFHTVALGLPPAALTAVALAAVRGLGSIRPLVLNDQVVKPLLRLAAVGTVVTAGGDAVSITLAWALPQWVMLPWAMFSLQRYAKKTAHPSTLDDGLARSFRRYTTLRGVSASVEIMGMHAGLLLVGATLGAADAGVYSVAMRLVFAGFLTLQAFRLAFAPQLSSALAQPTKEYAQLLHQASSGWIVLSAWPIYIVMIVLPTHVLRFFGPEFEAGWTTLSIAALGGLVSVAAGNIQSVLSMSGRAGAYLGVAIASVLANVTATVLLVPVMGLNGAAMGFLVACLTENGIAIYLCRRKEAIHHFGAPVVTAYLVNLGTIGVGCLVVRLGDLSGVAEIVVIFGSLVLYGLACWHWRETLVLQGVVGILGNAIRGKGALSS